MTSIAIIGAGLSGLTAANILNDYAEVTIFEKSRGVSGRMSTRRAEPYFFDHGAQYFKARTSEFKAFIDPMIKEGIIATWHARFVEFENKNIIQSKQWDEQYPHYVGVPGMNAIAKYLSQGLNVRLGVRVQSIKKNQGRWHLMDEQGNVLGEYDWVIAAIPAEQASELVPPSLPFYAKMTQYKMKGCFSLMLGFEKTLPLEFDAAMVRAEDVSWISVNNSKPGRDNAFSLLVHSSNEWADKHMHDDSNKIMSHLCKQTSELIGHDLSGANHKALHRWRFANIKKQSGEAHLLDIDHHMGVCGDWFIQGRVEAAFTSATEMASALVRSIRGT